MLIPDYRSSCFCEYLGFVCITIHRDNLALFSCFSLWLLLVKRDAMLWGSIVFNVLRVYHKSMYKFYFKFSFSTSHHQKNFLFIRHLCYLSLLLYSSFIMMQVTFTWCLTCWLFLDTGWISLRLNLFLEEWLMVRCHIGNLRSCCLSTSYWISEVKQLCKRKFSS